MNVSHEHKRTFLMLLALGKISTKDFARIRPAGEWCAVPESGFVAAPDDFTPLLGTCNETDYDTILSKIDWTTGKYDADPPADSTVYFAKLYRNEATGETLPYTSFLHFRELIDGWMFIEQNKVTGIRAFGTSAEDIIRIAALESAETEFIDED